MPYVKFQIRRGTEAEWNSAPGVVLAEGEMGYNTTVNRLKIGDGIKTWAQLDYVVQGSTGPTGPSQGPPGWTGPSGPSGRSGASGTPGANGTNGKGWSGQYIRVGLTPSGNGAIFTANSQLLTQSDGTLYNRGTWTVTDTRATLTIADAEAKIPQPIFGYIAWNTALTGNPVYKFVSVPYGSSTLDYPQVTVSRNAGNTAWVIDIDITSATFKDGKNIQGTTPAYGAFIYI